MIFIVIWTYALFRGAAVNDRQDFPYGWGAFFSDGWARCWHPLGHTANVSIETVALLLHIGVMLVFLLIVLHSKHLHIGLAPINVTFKRLPDGLGPLLPMEYKGEPIDFEDPAEDAVFGRGKIEDFTWKGWLDFTTCTECGRCQSQCPAWNTGKPLSPKLLIMYLRDHVFAKAPYLLGGKEIPGENTAEGWRRRGAASARRKHDEARTHVPESGFERILGSGPEQATRPLVGTARAGRRHRPRRAVVVHHLRRLRRAVPRRHRAHRPHRRHAPLPGDDRVGVPRRARRAVQEPGEQGQPLGPERQGPHQLDRRGRLRRAGLRRGRRLLRRLRVPVLGRLRRRLRGPRQEDHQGRRRTARHRGREVHGAGRRRDLHRRLRPPRRQRVPVPAARRAERRDAQRAVRGRRDASTARSSSPARTASTRSAASTRRSAATTRWCTTPSC